ncbi:hypothetical protein EUTSA_v10014792mg [Eutrema salsugineum]|uniref:Oxidative stress 3 n=1 Tax=Eutrema salsugineum TaxID=72664 RepID=V4LJY4_EUTSA|nr:uncharacterized protein LOC18016775 [Eutrema salsugineum]ESQ42762.1 hypothetical protein EUTSA_v10014792mg [Eutrema salsugineum]
MNLHLNLNLKQMGDMIYDDSRRTNEEEEEDIVEGVSRSMLAAETFSEEEEEDSSSCSLSSMCSSSDLTEDDDDDASSSSSNGPLGDLSDLMSHLPIKRGLSKFYEGKSQSFTSLANVKSLEDLMKRGFKNRNYGARRRKACRSTGGIIDQSYKRVYSPKATISKKASRTTSSALSCLSRRRH